MSIPGRQIAALIRRGIYYEKITPATTGKTVRIQLEIQLNPGETLAVDSDSRVEGWVEVI
ncbi:MAG: hypothetical protein IJQ46_01980 [Oscillospiraceae bacterium]|nr:hypothetical protein [Oscillospiraceae bacterium]